MSKPKALKLNEGDLLEFRVEPMQKDPDVSNPLRFRKVSDRLGAELFPKLSVYTQRAKYFGLILYWAKHGWLSGGSAAAHRLDQLMMCAFVKADTGNDTGLVGLKYKSRLNFSSPDGILPTKHTLSTSSLAQYGPPLKNFGLISSNRITEAGKEFSNSLVNSLGLPESKEFLNAVSDFVFRGRAFPSRMLYLLARWDLSSMSSEYKRLLKRLFGMTGKPAEGKTKSLGAALNLLEDIRHDRPSMFHLLQRNDSDRLISASGRWNKRLIGEYQWRPSTGNRLITTESGLNHIQKFDRLLFFSQTIFELLYFRCCRASRENVSLVSFCAGLNKLSVPRHPKAIERMRLNMFRLGAKVAQRQRPETELKITLKEENALLKWAWIGFQLARQKYTYEFDRLLADIGSDLDGGITRSWWVSDSPREVCQALTELHERYTKLRGVGPWLHRDGEIVVKELSDYTYAPSLFFVRDENGSFFRYRIPRMALLVGDLAS